jgi:hypothetical protein
MDNNKFLSIVLATDTYIRFVPYFIYSTIYFNRMFNIDFLVFVSPGKSGYLKKFLKLVENSKPNIKIVEVSYEQMNQVINKDSNQKYLLYFRYLVDPKYYEEYDYVLVGDVDVLVLTDLCTNRIFYMKNNNVSYCNRLRKIYSRYNGINRLYGCHSFKVKPYLEKYREKILKCTPEYITNLNIIDEQLLYYLVMDNNELDIIKKNPPSFDIISGYHLGDLKQKQLKWKIESVLPPDYFINLLQILRDPTFLEIHKIYNTKYISHLYDFLVEYDKKKNLSTENITA